MVAFLWVVCQKNSLSMVAMLEHIKTTINSTEAAAAGTASATEGRPYSLR